MLAQGDGVIAGGHCIGSRQRDPGTPGRSVLIDLVEVGHWLVTDRAGFESEMRTGRSILLVCFGVGLKC